MSCENDYIAGEDVTHMVEGKRQGIEFYVPGLPQPQGSAKGFKSKTGKVIITTDNPRLHSWRVDVANAAKEHIPHPTIAGPMAVEVRFEFPRPKGHYGTGRNAALVKGSAPDWHTTKPDGDKLLRATLDALTGIAYRDDSQVVRMSVVKRYAESAGTTIIVWEVDQ